ncbi:MgtC/SapB family protein [Streptomyces sp. A3M-1-3]|uniref:MgtC/SapB family protein n=1 Tax=Streptomyces sp. A3M-1-3 TaxID=2962044 RepID=UPI002660154D|nr:MgtC/SapB family protein [Streptomyces sp. A3M-1-3]
MRAEARRSWVGCGALIGMERQWRARMASLRTNALVATGATGIRDLHRYIAATTPRTTPHTARSCDCVHFLDPSGRPDRRPLPARNPPRPSAAATGARERLPGADDKIYFIRDREPLTVLRDKFRSPPWLTFMA